MALIAWLGVVVAGSTMTWATINTAGQEVLSRGAVPTARETDGGTPSRRDEGTPRPDPRRKPTPNPPARRTPSPAPSPSPEGPTSSPDPSRRQAPTPQPTRSTPTNESPRTAAWRGGAGSVTVLCTGSSISLQAASPNNGYSVEVRERGPEEVEVRLVADDAETRVEASCSSGRAQFDVDS